MVNVRNLSKKGFQGTPNKQSIGNEKAKALLNDGKLDEAQAAYELLIEEQPSDEMSLCWLATIHIKKGNLEPAKIRLQQALALNPNIATAHYNLAKLYYETGEVGLAAEHYESALRLNPNDFKITFNYANILNKNGNKELAIRMFNSAIRLKPENPETYWSIGKVYEDLRNDYKALESYVRATEVDPSFTNAWEYIGNLTRKRGHFIRSIDCYREALIYDPNRVSLHINLSLSYHAAGMDLEALQSARKAIELSKSSELVSLQCLPMLSRACDFERFPKHLESSIRNLLKDFNSTSQKVIPTYMMQALHQNTTLEQHRDYIKLTKAIVEHPRFNPEISLQNTDNLHRSRLSQLTSPNRDTIKIGFISGDFRTHVVMRFLLPLLRHLNKQNASIHLFNSCDLNLDADPVNKEARELAVTYEDIVNMDTMSACKLIRARQVDFLVDLAGHSAKNRMDVFTQRLAPVQFSWLGYPGSTGMRHMDFLLIDNHLNNPHLQSICTEKLITKNGPFLCFDTLAEELIHPNLPEERNGYITFGTLNNPRKYNQAMLKTWAEILRKVEGSKLLILRSGIDNPETSSNIHKEFKKNGIPKERIILKSPNHEKHFLAGYNAIDIALDTFPYSGTTTTLDTLWMGVPVVSMTGIAIHQRASESLLCHIGFPEWVATTREEYINIAVHLSQQTTTRRECRKSLRKRLLDSQLCNQERFAEDFMEALRSMINCRLKMLNDKP